VGDGPERAALQRLVGRLGMENTVRFLGHRGDVPDVLSAMNIAGRERRRAEFNLETMIHRLEDLYCELLAGRSAMSEVERRGT
jgi:glycosyltransferase involved in cell wall biosynthesis